MGELLRINHNYKEFNLILKPNPGLGRDVQAPGRVGLKQLICLTLGIGITGGDPRP